MLAKHGGAAVVRSQALHLPELAAQMAMVELPPASPSNVTSRIRAAAEAGKPERIGSAPAAA